MRPLLVVAALAGCYRPSDPACMIACTQGVVGSCPSDLVCGTASLCESMTGPTCNGLLDARHDMNLGDDAEVDGPSSGCNVTSFPTATALVAGSHLTPDRSHTRFSLLTSVVTVNENVPDSDDPTDYVPVLNPPGTEIYSARIDPTGELIYLSSDSAMMAESTIYVTRRQGPATFGPGETVMLSNSIAPVPLPVGAIVGGSTDPQCGVRRMPISTLGRKTGFDEYREGQVGTDTSFILTRTTTAAQLGVTFMSDPSFTSDGLRVVFVGAQGQTIGIFTSTRANVDAGWSPAELLRVANSQASNPYLTQDCTHLYWTEVGISYHAVHD